MPKPKKSLSNLQETIISRSLSDPRANEYRVPKGIDKVNSKDSGKGSNHRSHHDRSRQKLKDAKSSFITGTGQASNVTLIVSVGNFIILLALIIGFSKMGGRIDDLSDLVKNKFGT